MAGKVRVAVVTAFVWGLTLTGAVGASAPEKVDPGEVKVLQERMLTDPAIMELVLELRSNPEIQSILNDPAMRTALERGELDKLLQDPRFVKLLSNPLVKEIGGQLE